MFEPGHVRLANPVAVPGVPVYCIDLYYEVCPCTTAQAPMVQFRMVGEVSGEPFEEAFEMSHDTAFNFASMTAKVAARHGMPPDSGPVMRNHQEFDAMFADLRAKLEAAASGA